MHYTTEQLQIVFEYYRQAMVKINRQKKYPPSKENFCAFAGISTTTYNQYLMSPEENKQELDVINKTLEQAREENEQKANTDNERNRFSGRKIIYCNLQKDELTPENIIAKMPEILAIHNHNVTEIEYLDNFYKGIQPILEKTKTVRSEINNKILVNHAYEIVEFKKSYVFGDPVQYVQKGEKGTNTTNPAISLLNKFMESEDKPSKDKELAEWWYKIGTGYRWADIDTPEDEDEAPFEISTPDPKRTGVVYSTGITEKQLFSFYIQNFTGMITTQETSQIGEYQEYTIYLEDKVMVLTTQYGKLQLKPLNKKVLGIFNKKLPNPYPLLIKGHRIIEYPLNKNRIGLIELVISQLNAINRITSNELDDIEQFVQSLLVYINQQIDIETHKKLIKLGAMQVFTQEPRKTSRCKIVKSKIIT